MSLLKLTWRYFTAVTILVTGPTVFGQTNHPFADPLQFDPDWQFFAPVDMAALNELSPRKRAPVGWYGTYDREHLWVSRPSDNRGLDQGDWGWGNRFDLGYMTEKHKGWLFSFRHLGGPGAIDKVYQERNDRVNANDTGDPLNPVAPVEANDPQFGVRAYWLGESVNVLGMSNWELNKVWRREPYRYGGILEPMIGLKFTNLLDTAIKESYVRNVNATDLFDNTATAVVEELTSDLQYTRNVMFGGQVGARYFTHYERWTLSGEFRAFLMNNQQEKLLNNQVFRTQYSAAGAGSTVTAIRNTNDITRTLNTTTLWGFEARGEAAYQLTRNLSGRFGVDVIDFANGIWRSTGHLGPNQGGFGGSQDQSVTMAGFTFGMTLNR